MARSGEWFLAAGLLKNARTPSVKQISLFLQLVLIPSPGPGDRLASSSSMMPAREWFRRM